MSMQAKRTRLRFGAVSAEVGLVKASTKPKAAEHETRRVLVEPTPEHGRITMTTLGAPAEPLEPATDPFGDPVPAPVAERDPGAMPEPVRPDPDVVEHETGRNPETEPDWREQSTEPQRQRVDHDVDPTHPDTPPAPSIEERTEALVTAHGLPRDRAERVARGFETLGGDILALTDEELRHEPGGDLFRPDVPESAPTSAPGAPEVASPAPTYIPPATRVEQGVHLENGTWVDLTDRLTEVDERTRVDGLEVVRTLPASSYASEHVRELHYVVGDDPSEFKVLALLWHALRAERAAAEVRWTKRTAQARGIILARGEAGKGAHLALLELEWAQNVRPVPAKASGPVAAEVAPEEVAAAVELVESFRAPTPRAELRDERLAKRAELLKFARAGKLAEYVPPAEPMPEDLGVDAGLVEALELAAAWNREHAPA
jgi:non-homologous end joining protein Ku